MSLETGPGPSRRGPGRPRHESPSEDYRKRRNEIIVAATEVFREKGYQAPLEDIAESLDLRKGSLYYYIDSKSELLRVIFDQAISVALERIEQIQTDGGTSRQRLENLIRHQVEVVSQDTSMFAVFFDQRPHLQLEHETEIRDKERRYLRLYEQMVNDAIEDEVLDATNARYTSQILIGASTWLYKWFDSDRDDADEVADVLIRLLLR